MKAWQADSAASCEGFAVIVFADSRGKAKSLALGRDELNGAEFGDVRIKRAPKFDGREANPPSLFELVTEQGWFTDCVHCETRIERDADEDPGEGEPRRPGRAHRLGVLCEACANKSDEELRAENERWRRRATVLPAVSPAREATPGTNEGGGHEA